MSHHLTIGELARLSGLSASALRFYDREGVLVPAEVDASSGYRRYEEGQVPDARVVAHLRRVGMPLSEVALVLDLRARGESEAARDVVVAHETRLEEGLLDARREIARTLDLLAGHAPTSTVRVTGTSLASALRSVRFAVAEATSDLSVLTGVLAEVVPDGLRLVATDRYRLAIGHAAGEPIRPATTGSTCVLPPVWIEEVAATAGDGPVELELSPAGCRGSLSGETRESPCVPGDFPDYRRILDWGRATSDPGVDASRFLVSPELRGSGESIGVGVTAGVAHPAGDGEAVVHVNPEFLLEALDAVDGTPALVLDGPIAPLAIRGSDGGLSILMPVATP